jgi:hypothetical protein
MAEKNKKPLPEVLSRRSFARGVAMAAAAVAVAPTDLLAQTQPPPSTGAPAPEKPAEQTPKLSPGSQAEAEAKIQDILRKYGSRFSDAEKADIRKSVLALEESLEKLRAFPLQNWDEPALVLRAVTKEK